MGADAADYHDKSIYKGKFLAWSNFNSIIQFENISKIIFRESPYESFSRV